MALNEKSKKVFEFVKANQGENITAADIVEGTGLEIRSVNGIVTSAFQKKGIMERIPAEIEVTDAEGKVSHKAVKFIRLTEAGLDFDPDAPDDAE
jgi:hypothetical protein